MSPHNSDTTREALCEAALASLREDGVARLSARRVAARAGVNQALIFYHFGTVADLVDAACRQSVDAAVARYRAGFAAAKSLADLLQVGRELNEQERALGSVTVMAQLLAGAQQDEGWARTAQYCIGQWQTQIETVVRRVTARGVLAGRIDPGGIAAAISAGFLGLELYEGADPDGARRALDALEQLGALLAVVDDLGPVARRAVEVKLRSTAPRRDRG